MGDQDDYTLQYTLYSIYTTIKPAELAGAEKPPSLEKAFLLSLDMILGMNILKM